MDPQLYTLKTVRRWFAAVARDVATREDALALAQWSKNSTMIDDTYAADKVLPGVWDRMTDQKLLNPDLAPKTIKRGIADKHRMYTDLRTRLAGVPDGDPAGTKAIQAVMPEYLPRPCGDSGSLVIEVQEEEDTEGESSEEGEAEDSRGPSGTGVKKESVVQPPVGVKRRRRPDDGFARRKNFYGRKKGKSRTTGVHAVFDPNQLEVDVSECQKGGANGEPPGLSLYFKQHSRPMDGQLIVQMLGSFVRGTDDIPDKTYVTYLNRNVFLDSTEEALAGRCLGSRINCPTRLYSPRLGRLLRGDDANCHWKVIEGADGVKRVWIYCLADLAEQCKTGRVELFRSYNRKDAAYGEGCGYPTDFKEGLAQQLRGRNDPNAPAKEAIGGYQPRPSAARLKFRAGGEKEKPGDGGASGPPPSSKKRPLEGSSSSMPMRQSRRQPTTIGLQCLTKEQGSKGNEVISISSDTESGDRGASPRGTHEVYEILESEEDSEVE